MLSTTLHIRSLKTLLHEPTCLPLQKKDVLRHKQQKRYRLELSTYGGRSSVSGVIATVFGATGFLGRYVVNQLGRVGSQMIVPYRGEEKSYRHLKVMGDLGQIVPYKWDITDKDSIRTAAKYSNVIINLTGRKFDTRNFSMRDVHVEGAKRIAEVAKELNVERFIHVSALGASTNSPSAWLRSKAEGEAAVRSIFPDVTIIRTADMFGTQDQFLHHHASMMRYWPFYPLIHPNKKVQPVWVNDVASAVLSAVKYEETVGKIYELGGPQIFTLKEIGQWVKIVLKLNPTMVEVSEDVIWHLGYWLGQHRKPRYTLDSIKESEDVVTSGKYPGLPQLHIVPTSMHSETGMGIILHYRKPLRQQDVSLDQLELPEGVVPGKPAY